MSLINDVLRDLERRGESQTTPQSAGATSSTGRPRRWLWWLAAAVTAGVLLHWMVGGTFPDSQPEETLVDAGPADREPAPADNGPPPLLQPVPRVVAAEMAPRPRADDTASESPDSGTAQATPDTGKASPVTKEDPGPESTAAANAPAAQEHRPESTDDSRDIVRNDVAQAGGNSPAREMPPPTRTEPSAEDSRIVIRRSGGEPDADAAGFAAAQRALAHGNSGLAAARLQDLLQSRPGHVEARLLLARVHAEAGRPRSAAAVLEAGLAQDAKDSRLAYLLGRIRLEQGQLASALRVLEDHAPPAQESAEYHLLIAAAHRQAGDDQAAAAVYRALTGAHPALGPAWVGLGVCLESEGRNADARSAYRRALQGDDRRAAAFARQRLSVMPEGAEPGTDQVEVP